MPEEVSQIAIWGEDRYDGARLALIFSLMDDDTIRVTISGVPKHITFDEQAITLLISELMEMIQQIGY